MDKVLDKEIRDLITQFDALRASAVDSLPGFKIGEDILALYVDAALQLTKAENDDIWSSIARDSYKEAGDLLEFSIWTVLYDGVNQIKVDLGKDPMPDRLKKKRNAALQGESYIREMLKKKDPELSTLIRLYVDLLSIATEILEKRFEPVRVVRVLAQA